MSCKKIFSQTNLQKTAQNDDKKLQVDALLRNVIDREPLHPDMFVSITLYSINHMKFDIKGMGVLPRKGILSHLALYQYKRYMSKFS